MGTEQETPPLVLKDCLSYDEMKISALVYTSGHTQCINDGTRKNAGVVKTDDIETEAVIIGKTLWCDYLFFTRENINSPKSADAFHYAVSEFHVSELSLLFTGFLQHY